ncbi:MAG: hypothetical protein PF692_02150 [Kiritimatiellae bacterium]|jgi:hypothetical protein|nr:hypothetical protein [Kiritimatiellia bacterium]
MTSISNRHHLVGKILNYIFIVILCAFPVVFLYSFFVLSLEYNEKLYDIISYCASEDLENFFFQSVQTIGTSVRSSLTLPVLETRLINLTVSYVYNTLFGITVGFYVFNILALFFQMNLFGYYSNKAGCSNRSCLLSCVRFFSIKPSYVNKVCDNIIKTRNYSLALMLFNTGILLWLCFIYYRCRFGINSIKHFESFYSMILNNIDSSAFSYQMSYSELFLYVMGTINNLQNCNLLSVCLLVLYFLGCLTLIKRMILNVR